MLVLSQLTGNQNVKAAAVGFAQAEILAAYYVSLAVYPGNFLDKMSAIGPFADLKRRNHDPILRSITHMWPWMEFGRMIATKSGISSLTVPTSAPFNIHKVVKAFDKFVANNLGKEVRKGVKAVYGYEDTVLSTFLAAKKLNINCLYDLPIGYWRSAHQLLEGERDRWPEWIPTLTGLADSEEKLADKDQELKLADRIFVASNFTAQTLNLFPGKLAPIEVIPYGFPPVAVSRIYERDIENRPLKLLFVGGLSQRKGIADLFAAVDVLGNAVELTVVGVKKNDNCVPLNRALSKYNWFPSMPHHKVLELMKENDILVFPSLFEGFGLVITEAMSQGTPVITTDRTIGPNFIEHGRNGWLVKAGSTESLLEVIEEIMAHPEDIAEIGMAAMKTAAERPWTVYSKEIAEAVVKAIHPRPN